MSATPEQIAERLDGATVRADELPDTRHVYTTEAVTNYVVPLGLTLADIRAAAALIRAQAERVRVLEALLQRLEPSIGWRSATGTSRDFACEFCHQTHEHFEKIEHTDKCPVTQVRAALKAAP